LSFDSDAPQVGSARSNATRVVKRTVAKRDPTVLYFSRFNTALVYVATRIFSPHTGYMFRQLCSTSGKVLHRMAACGVLFNLQRIIISHWGLWWPSG